uniref:Uncharacterized protein n=1 Tax=Geospiza parvula TaxID=87175 RepID=A0A8U8B1G2_GEOPR
KSTKNSGATPPAVFPLVACSSSGSAPSRPIGCLASGFIPAPVSFSWSPAPPAPGPAPIPPALGQSGLAKAGSRLLLPEGSGSFSCSVRTRPPGSQRASGSKVRGRIFGVILGVFWGLSQPHKPRPPAVSVFQSCPAPDVVELLCLVTDFAPPTATIDWLMDGDVVEPGHAHTEEATPGHAPGRFRAVSRLNVSAAEWRDHQRFSCRVRHGPTRRCRRCRRRGATVSSAGWGGPPGKRHAPSVFLFPPPPEEISSSLPTLSLTCLVRGFSPDSIDVQWGPKPRNSPQNLGPVRESGADGRFFLYSRLEATRDEWERGDAFVCTVVHEGLPLRFLQRSVRKPPVIDSLTSVS